jgi:hypothetical protein
VDATRQLSGWSRERRGVVLRRRLREARSPRARRHRAKQQRSLLVYSGVEISSCEVVDYEYQILITNLPYGLETLAPMYRARGDAENPFDELKNQWGWGGFTTHALAPGQHTARLIALVCITGGRSIIGWSNPASTTKRSRVGRACWAGSPNKANTPGNAAWRCACCTRMRRT